MPIKRKSRLKLVYGDLIFFLENTRLTTMCGPVFRCNEYGSLQSYVENKRTQGDLTFT